MIRAIKQYGISALLLIVAILCIFNIGQNIQDAFTVITNSLALLLAVVYFVNFEKDIIIKIKKFVLNIKWPFHGKTKRILTNFLNFIIEKRWDIISYLFIFLLLIITLGQFSYLERFINVSWINKYQVILTVLAILSGGLTFWHNRERVEKEIDEEQIDEQRIEDKRKTEFASKFPRINKIPVVRNLVKWMYKEGWIYSISIIIICFSFLSFGINHLGQFMSVDEPKWVNTRVPQLYEALKERKWEKTFINDKPGILPAFLSGAVNIFLDHDYYKARPLEYEHYLFWWRLPILLFNFFLLFIIYYFLKKLFQKDHALLITGLVGLNPILIGISQIVNPDATLWSVGFLSFITFFIYLKSNNKKYIYYSGLFFGLSLISKYFASLFYIFYFLVIYLEHVIDKTTVKQFYQRCLDLGKLFIISILIYTLLFTATWVNSSQIFKGTIGADILSPGIKYIFLLIFFIFFEITILKNWILKKIRKIDLLKFLKVFIGSIFLFTLILLLFNTVFDNLFFDYNNYIFINYEKRDLNIFNDTLASLYTILITLTYPLLFGLFSLLFYSNKKTRGQFFLLFLISCFLFIIIYLLGSSFGGFAIDARYQIILYPIYASISAIILLNLFKNKILIIIVAFIISFVTIISSKPFYYHYNNSLNMKNYNITEAWGFGGYELAQIMNKLPGAENIVVWSDREGFNEFFIGKSYWRGRDNPFSEELDIDYLILTEGGERIFNRALLDYQKNKKYLYTIIAGETTLLNYYGKKQNDELFFCVNKSHNCIWAIKK